MVGPWVPGSAAGALGHSLVDAAGRSGGLRLLCKALPLVDARDPPTGIKPCLGCVSPAASVIQHDSGLPQGPGGVSGASCVCKLAPAKLAQRVPGRSPCST